MQHFLPCGARPLQSCMLSGSISIDHEVASVHSDCCLDPLYEWLRITHLLPVMIAHQLPGRAPCQLASATAAAQSTLEPAVLRQHWLLHAARHLSWALLHLLSYFLIAEADIAQSSSEHGASIAPSAGVMLLSGLGVADPVALNKRATVTIHAMCSLYHSWLLHSSGLCFFSASELLTALCSAGRTQRPSTQKQTMHNACSIEAALS